MNHFRLLLLSFMIESLNPGLALAASSSDCANCGVKSSPASPLSVLVDRTFSPVLSSLKRSQSSQSQNPPISPLPPEIDHIDKDMVREVIAPDGTKALYAIGYPKPGLNYIPTESPNACFHENVSKIRYMMTSRDGGKTWKYRSCFLPVNGSPQNIIGFLVTHHGKNIILQNQNGLFVTPNIHLLNNAGKNILTELQIKPVEGMQIVEVDLPNASGSALEITYPNPSTPKKLLAIDASTANPAVLAVREVPSTSNVATKTPAPGATPPAPKSSASSTVPLPTPAEPLVAAADGTFSVNWSCANDYNLASFNSKNIKISLDFSRNKLYSPELDRLFPALDAEGRKNGFDFTSCIHRFDSNIVDGIISACEKSDSPLRRIGMGFEQCKSTFKASWQNQLDGIKKSITPLNARTKILPFLPGTKAGANFTAQDAKQLKVGIDLFCGTSRLDPDYPSFRLLLTQEGQAFAQNQLRQNPGCLAKLGGPIKYWLDRTFPDKEYCDQFPSRCVERKSAYVQFLASTLSKPWSDTVVSTALAKAITGSCNRASSSCVVSAEKFSEIAFLHDSESFRNFRPDSLSCQPPMGSRTYRRIDLEDSGTTMGSHYILKGATPETLKEDYVSSWSKKKVPQGTPVLRWPLIIDFDFSIKDSNLSQNEARKAVAGCLDTIKDRIRDEAGNFITVRLYDPSIDSERPPSVSISLASKSKQESGMREREWFISAISPTPVCDWIIHEGMHAAMGLVDLYEQKKDINFNTAFDCRVPSPPSSTYDESIMANSDRVYSRAAGKAELDVFYCDCGQEECSASCPNENIKSAHWAWPNWKRRYNGNASVQNVGDPYFLNAARKTRILKLVPTIQQSSILSPAEFNHILTPGCIEKNWTFMACAREFQKSSQASQGTGSCNPFLPPVCQKGTNDWLRMNQGRSSPDLQAQSR